MFSFFKRFSTLEIYTDGSSKNGVGSWAYIISKRGKNIIEKSGHVRRACSNTMEFQAAIEALSSISVKSKIILYSDSKILVETMNFGVGPSAFQKQINILITLSRKHIVVWRWVKAHNGDVLNERCDELCALARQI